MQGWLISEPSRGTFVASDLPVMKLARPSHAIRDHISTPKAHAPLIRVSDGLPDPRIMPQVELARAFRRVMSGQIFLRRSDYGDPRGVFALREALAGFSVHQRGLAASPEEVIVTRGSQMAIFLAASAVVAPGQSVAVETPGYPFAWSAFRAAGARVMGVPVDENGINVEHLARIAECTPELRAVYVTPHHQYPTTVTLGAGRRLKLLETARRYGLTIIEDDYDHDYRFDGRPVLPLASREEADLPIVYIGSFSKLLAPAIRLGYAVARPEILERMAARREMIDRQGDVPLELALADLIADGTLGRHTRKARRIYQERRDVLIGELRRNLVDDLQLESPAGGLAVWVRLRPGLNAERWVVNAERAGLSIAAGSKFALNSAEVQNAFRFGYADMSGDELRSAVSVLTKTRPQ